MKNRVYSVLIAMLVLSLVLVAGPMYSAASSAMFAPQAASPQGVQLDGTREPVMLLLHPSTSTLRVPPPERFTQRQHLATQTATININYLSQGATDAFGSSCLTWPADARAASEHAARIWETLITSDVTIKVNACWTNLGAGYLGYGRAEYRLFSGAPVANTWYPTALANALVGSDLAPGHPDIHIGYNSAMDWYFGTDGNTPWNRVDFVSVALHEITHGLGFAGSMNVANGQGHWGSGTDYPDIYDRFAQDGSGISLLNTSDYPNHSIALANALTSDNVWFSGTNANAANDGGRVKLYAPNPWVSGSSYSHLDYDTFKDTENALMVYRIPYGQSTHDPGPVTMGILRDIGWASTSAPPTPTPSPTPSPTPTPSFTPTASPTPTPSPTPTASPTPPSSPTPLLPPSVTSIQPNTGEKTGSVAFSIEGSDFQSGATVRLTRSGETDILAYGVTVNATTIIGSFDLTGAAEGAWSVVGTNPDAQSATLPNGFTVTFSGNAWEGVTDDDWHTASNWEAGEVPGIGDDVLIPESANVVIASADVAIKSLLIESDARLDLTTRALTVENALNNHGALAQTLGVSAGGTMQFLHITNQAVTQTRYYGIDITPTEAQTNVAAPHIRLSQHTFDPLAEGVPPAPPAFQMAAVADDAPRYDLVQFAGPIASDDVAALEAAGARVFDYVPDFAFIVKMDGATRAAVAQLDTVRWIGPYQPAYRLSADLTVLAARTLASADGPVLVAVSIFPDEPVADITAQIAALGGAVLEQSATSWHSKLQLAIAPARLPEVAALPGVRWIERAPEWRLMNDVAAGVLGAREVWDTHGLHGSGQIVAVCDSGLDRGSINPDFLHADFQDGQGNSRVLVIQDWTGDGAGDTRSGHGTHVAGSVLGNGARSGATPATSTYPESAYVGIAPEASLVFQAVEDKDGYLSGIPWELEEIFGPAADNGAMIHTNSWGGAANGKYTLDSEAVDRYVWENPDFTLLFAAGNAGADKNADGVIDAGSIGSPATAKNCIAVGATENYRPDLLNTWGATWPADYPAAPISGDRIADNSEGMAAFSSRGPTLDGRYKPDVVAPGTFIISTRSSLETEGGWGEIDDDYMYMGGTSMATPLVAGAATLVRQFYTDVEGITPSAALLKATLINGATNIAPGQYGTGATQEIPDTRPNNVIGWGRVNVTDSLFPAAPRAWFYEDAAGLITNATAMYTYTVTSSAEPLFVTLAWSDYPGSIAANGALVNDLDLTITGPDAATYYPHNGTGPDRVNNVLGIEIASPPHGVYTVTVSGYNVPRGPQPYALVASGAITLTSPAAPVTPAPTLTTITPATGVNSGTVSITLTGNHFQTGATISLTHTGQQDIVGANVDVISATTLIGDFDLFGALVASWDVVITNPDAQQATLVDGFAISASPTAPEVAETSREAGENVGVISITVTGSNFQTGTLMLLTRVGEADIEGTNCEVITTTITCDFDLTGAATGAWDIVVVNPDGQRGQLEGGFTINMAAAPSQKLHVAIAGRQFCAERESGIRRCFEITAEDVTLQATVRFYFTEAELNDLPVDEHLVVFRQTDQGWVEEPGPYDRQFQEGIGYVEVQNVGDLSSATTRFALDSNAPDAPTVYDIYLPLVLKHWPPIPATPVLHAINNADGDGDYTVSWGAAHLAQSYILEEATNSAFSDRKTRYTGPNISLNLTGKAPGTYYYRVRASRLWEGQTLYSGWSVIRSVEVLSTQSTVYVVNDTEGRLCYEIHGTGIGQKCFASSGVNYYGTFPAGTYTWSASAWCGTGRGSLYYPPDTFYHRLYCDQNAARQWLQSQEID